MQQQGSSFSDQSISILLAAGPQDEQARALVLKLRGAGLRVVFAETMNMAARVSEAAACVVVLRPDTWKTQTIATVMRAKPDCLIPVLAETMDLPRGPWTHEAISLANDPDQGEQELISALRDYLAARPAPKPVLRENAEPLTINQILAAKKRRRRRNAGPLITAILLLIIVGLGGLMGYRYYTNHTRTSLASNSTSGVSLPTATPHVSYAAKTPGQYCDPGNGQWGLGERYVKTVNKQKTEVIDKYTTLQCQTNGALLTRTGDYDVYSELFFDSSDSYSFLAQHYIAQVDATVTAGDAQADITMDVHIHDNGYGRYNFDVNTLGHWEATTGSTIDGSTINRLAIGFLPRGARTYTLKVEVNGPVMTFWINGIQVTTVTDTTYADNSAIGFGVNDWSAKSPVSALFSNFQYEELPPSTLATPVVVATATAQAQASLQTSYTARVPGYNCDKGAGQWQPPADLDADKATLHCLPNGLQLTEPGTTDIIGEENFYWRNGHFPQNYQVSAQIDASGTGSRCAGLGTRANDNGDEYIFAICADGSWEIDLLTNTFHTLAQGQIGAQNVYTLTARLDASVLSLSINGQLMKTVNDSHLKTTDHLSLLVGLYKSNQPATAIFSNFVFTPLP